MAELEHDRVRDGAVAGAVAFVAGVLGTVLLAGPEDDTDLWEFTAMGTTDTVTYGEMGSQGELAQPETWKVAGWVFHQAHFASIDTQTDVSTDSAFGGMANYDLAFAMEPSVAVRVLPVVLLVGAGYVLADRASADEQTAAALDGAHVLAGYAPLAVLSAFLFAYEDTHTDSSAEVTLSVQPEVTSALLFTGILVPVVLGAVGGYANHVLSGPE